MFRERTKQLKTGISQNAGRIKRAEHVLQLRKDDFEEQMKQRRKTEEETDQKEAPFDVDVEVNRSSFTYLSVSLLPFPHFPFPSSSQPPIFFHSCFHFLTSIFLMTT